MIARQWRGVVPNAKSAAYLQLMRTVALPDYGSIPGNRGSWCLHRCDDRRTTFQMLTFWDDIEAVKRFAGDNYSKAKYYDFDQDYLIEAPADVRHFDVIAGAGDGRERAAPLIARYWTGKVSLAQADEYASYLAEFGLEDYDSYAGARGAYLLRDDDEAYASFILLSFWLSREAIANYAGEDIERARYYEFDLARLIEPPAYVEHYDTTPGAHLNRA